MAVALAALMALQGGAAALAAPLAAVAGAQVPQRAAGAQAPQRATGDWGFTHRFTALKLPVPPLVWEVRLECFSASGCTADAGLVFGPTDSNGHGITFTGTTATSEPLVDSLGRTVGVCRSTPAPSGSVTCRSHDSHIDVPDGGYVEAATTVTFAAFTPTKAGEPLASSSWSDSPSQVNPRNNLDNDEQEIITTPKPNPVETWIDPTATAFAAGQAGQTEEAGIICTSEGFCWAKAGTTFRAQLKPAGVYFAQAPGADMTIDGFDVAFSCRFGQTGGYAGPGTNIARCSLLSRSIIDHYGEAFIRLTIKAAAASYPQNHNYGLVLHPWTGMSGQPIGTDLSIVAPVVITTTSPLPPGTESSAYSVTLAATGGVPTIKNPFAPPALHHRWAMVAGSLPPGLALRAGVISGTPTAGGTFTFTLRVSDRHGDSVEDQFTLVVNG